MMVAEGSRILEKRVKILKSLFVLCILILVGRLYYIQIVCGPALAAAALGQQQIPVIYPYSRGLIYDRNHEKLTNTTCEYYYLVVEKNCTDEFESLIGLIGGTKAGKKGENYVVYHVEQYQATVNALLQENHQAYGFCVSSRYADDQVAAHLIGYLNESDGTGACGVEQMYENQLGSDTPEVYLLGDGAGDVVNGIGLTDGDGTKELPAGLVLTIDAGLQRDVEAVLAQKGISGAVIINASRTGQILTMASSPSYNPNQLEDYLTVESSELVNKAVQCQYAPGPILDVVQEIGSMGKLSLMDAAESLGFGQCVWENFPNEVEGSLTDDSMEITPIQVSQMLTTLANKGEKVPLTLVMSSAQGETVPCMNLAEKKWTSLLNNLCENPISGDGWAVGFSGSESSAADYNITVYVEDDQKQKKTESTTALSVFEEIQSLVEDAYCTN